MSSTEEYKLFCLPFFYVFYKIVGLSLKDQDLKECYV